MHSRDLDPYNLHNLIIRKHLSSLNSARQASDCILSNKTDGDIIRRNHMFLWDGELVDSREKIFAKKYYDKLFKEYCICDLSRYKENKQVALRWRCEKEVIAGKGHFICGNKTCASHESLRSWEVNFRYAENDIIKNALVKIRLCPNCSLKLNYHSKKREIKKNKGVKKTTIYTGASMLPVGEEWKMYSCKTEKGNIMLQKQREDNLERLWNLSPGKKESQRDDEFEHYLNCLLL